MFVQTLYYITEFCKHVISCIHSIFIQETTRRYNIFIQNIFSGFWFSCAFHYTYAKKRVVLSMRVTAQRPIFLSRQGERESFCEFIAGLPDDYAKSVIINDISLCLIIWEIVELYRLFTPAFACKYLNKLSKIHKTIHFIANFCAKHLHKICTLWMEMLSTSFCGLSFFQRTFRINIGKQAVREVRQLGKYFGDNFGDWRCWKLFVYPEVEKFESFCVSKTLGKLKKLEVGTR